MNKVRLCTAALIVVLCAGLAMSAEQMQLTSDKLRYDPDKGIIYASGNVRVTGRGAVATSSEGEASADGAMSHLWGDVRAEWAEGSKTLACDDLVTREAERGQKVFARNVSRFEDKTQNLVMKAREMEGLLVDGEFSELTATGNVVADTVAADGKTTRVTGDRAVYSKARGTLVFTGNALAVQKDRRITADHFVMHVESGKIEALGNPRMIVDMPPQEKKSQ